MDIHSEGIHILRNKLYTQTVIMFHGQIFTHRNASKSMAAIDEIDANSAHRWGCALVMASKSNLRVHIR
jgi:hypothetical protein